MMDRITGNVPVRWRGLTTMAPELSSAAVPLDARGTVPLDDGESDLTWVQIGQRYRLFTLQYILTGVLCRDCPNGINFQDTALLDRALVWIAEHERREHGGGNVRDPRDVDAEHGPIFRRRSGETW
jgi:hypothetical protein